MLIAENGFRYQDKFINQTVKDDYRMEYLKSHILEMKESNNDGAEVIDFVLELLLI
ncbi:family 1 glycosylhydrolase [Spiroplasma endosymbiont of Dioctria linearis]|uniref:family 1 glycosylhydrolase n=1 Tax=Spiroplasma endosymbiont of Dioctria linearis TaxID=3066290 RepID=UPI003CC7AA08